MNKLFILALCLYQVQSIRLPIQEKEEKQSEFLAVEQPDAGDVEEARLDEEALQNFVPSKELIFQWVAAGKKNGVDFGHLKQSMSDVCKHEVVAKLFKKKECADPWIQTKKCEKAYEIPGYRLGDEFFQFLSLRNTAEFAQFYFPKSIGDLYWKRHKHKADWDVINAVVDDPEYTSFERPDEKTLVIHVRAYDVLTKHEQSRTGTGYQKGNGYYNKVADNALKLGFESATIVTGDHKVTQQAVLSGKNASATEAVRNTDAKLAEISKIFTEKGLKVNLRRNMNADCDFVYMVNAKAFVPSGGGFDRIAGELVKRRGGTLITDNMQKKK